jgi:hypothetical protein|tara:strand:- start:111 stop:440 length:330 start_codon:yes stop_codon:yes gene_type:complete
VAAAGVDTPVLVVVDRPVVVQVVLALEAAVAVAVLKIMEVMLVQVVVELDFWGKALMEQGQLITPQGVAVAQEALREALVLRLQEVVVVDCREEALEEKAAVAAAVLAA